jgi:hypothetical protein
MGANNRFLSVDVADETVVCDKQRAGEEEMIAIRSNALRFAILLKFTAQLIRSY